MIIKTADSEKKEAIRVVATSYGIEYKELRKNVYGIAIEPELEKEFKEKITRRLKVTIHSIKPLNRR